MQYPLVSDSPTEILDHNNHCAPMSVWMVLENMQFKVTPEYILERLKVSEEYGTFTISIALLFHELGFETIFRTIEDLDKHADELPLYEEAKMKGLRIDDPISSNDFNDLIKSGSHLIVFYDEGRDEGHFSPVEAVTGSIIKLPMSNHGDLEIIDFEERRARAGYLKQSVEVSRKNAGDTPFVNPRLATSSMG